MTITRLRLGIPFNYDEGWIGGAYYILNLVSALNLLPEDRRPDVVLISSEISSFDFIQNGSGYDRLSWVTQDQMMQHDKAMQVDVLFPHPLPGQEHKTISWIPDFQDKLYPEFFSQTELDGRTGWHLNCFRTGGVVFSSNAVARDAGAAYPDVTIHGHVVPFATFNKDRPTDYRTVKSRYNLAEHYFYCPNQFWKHKNHKVVIRAVAELRRRGIEPQIYFSGKEHEPRFPDHVDELKQLVRDLGVGGNVRFLGFLPREDQLTIFRHADAVIQPSLSEGWSTVIEDAKWAGRYVIATDLDVHREQLSQNYTLFDGNNASTLAAVIETFMRDRPRLAVGDYRRAQRQFAHRFMEVVEHVGKQVGVPAQDWLNAVGDAHPAVTRRMRQGTMLRAQGAANIRSARAASARAAADVAETAATKATAAFEAELLSMAEVNLDLAISTTLSRAEIKGLGGEEGPYPELGLDALFHWIEGGRLEIRPHRHLLKNPRLEIDYRNIVLDQVLSYKVGKSPFRNVPLTVCGFHDTGRLKLELGEGIIRASEITILLGNPDTNSDGRTLSVLLSRIDLMEG